MITFKTGSDAETVIRDAANHVIEVQRTGRDITARVATERALESAREEAEAASRAKSRFLAVVSHEVRTPLNGILGMTHLLLETPLSQEQQTYARAVKSSGDALLGLIAEILDFSKIEAGRIDAVVVYKVDRLTRSLGDFAKIVEVFDRHSVSFVSVTQQFNTTTSMGRLTLNMLLSFAQFEREVTGERIRDKIAASKRKGMWMGGNVPLGYDAVDRKLVVNEAEAATVRRLFDLYLRLGSVQRVCEEARRLGLRTKPRTRRYNNRQGGERGLAPHPLPRLFERVRRPRFDRLAAKRRALVVLPHLRRRLEAQEAGERGPPIHVRHHLMAHAAGLDLPRPAGDARHAQAALPRLPLHAAQPAGAAAVPREVHGHRPAGRVHPRHHEPGVQRADVLHTARHRVHVRGGAHQRLRG